MTTHEVLVAARADLLENGWHQGYYTDGHGAKCVVGAVYHVTRWSDDGLEPLRLLDRLVPDGNVPIWNDTEGRTFAEVIDLFDRAIIETAPRACAREEVAA